MNAEDVTRMFMPRKSAQRTNSSSSVASASLSSSSSSSTITTPAPSTQANGERPTTNGEQGAWAARKKPQKGLWPPSKSESVSEVSNGRPPPIPTQSSGQSAASTLSAMHQPSPILPSQHRSTTQQQQSGNRIDQSPIQSEAPAILALQPLTGTFERKQINVPFFPEVLRIGRQTNAKTVPTAANGYFDSKVLSRQHAEVWADRNGKIWIRDVKSSNGTFVNGVRLSPENRDSEPHELREQDTLELGIDIVSEDQKSIVHHKVSAKVEHAGVYSTETSVLGLNFGDIDPSTGNALGQMGHGIPQLRGRGASQGSNASNGRLTGQPSVANGGANGISQRQMNLWMNPISIEQVVRRLTVSSASGCAKHVRLSTELDGTETSETTIARSPSNRRLFHHPSDAGSRGRNAQSTRNKVIRTKQAAEWPSGCSSTPRSHLAILSTSSSTPTTATPRKAKCSSLHACRVPWAVSPEEDGNRKASFLLKVADEAGTAVKSDSVARRGFEHCKKGD